MKKKIFVFVLSAMFLTSTIDAQPFGPGGGCRNSNPEMRKDVHEKIIPLIKTQRLELDKTINETDKAEIARLREELKTLRSKHFAKIQEFEKNDEAPTLEQRQEMRTMRSEMGSLMDEVAVIADKYDATIITLLEEIRPELEKLRLENCPAQPNGFNRCPNTPNGKKPNRHRGGKGQGMSPGEGFHHQRMLTPEGFLVFDPAEQFPIDENFGINAEQLNVNIFPNPASQSAQVSFELGEKSQVAILLLDSDGNELKKIETKNAESGLFSTTIDVANFKDGLYFVKIQAENKTALQRLIVKH